MIKNIIMDAGGSGKGMMLDPTGAAMVLPRPVPPYGEAQPMTPYRQFLSADGTTSGSTDMRVNGSSTFQTFYVQAHAICDRYILSLSFVIADAGAVLNEFGNISALANGCRLFYENDEGQINIATALTTNFRFVQLCNGNPAFGNTTNAFRASNVNSTSEGFLPVLNFRDVFGFPYGLRLRAGTKQRLVVEIRDNVSGVDEFTALAQGFDRAPE